MPSQATLDRPEQRVRSHFYFCKAPDTGTSHDGQCSPSLSQAEVWGGDPSLLGVSKEKECLTPTDG